MRVPTATLVTILAPLLWVSAPKSLAEAADRGSGPDVTVHITAAQSTGQPSTLQHDLEECTRELRDAVRKKKGLRVVDQAEGADVSVEVTNCEQQPGEGGFGGLKVTPLGEAIIRFKARWGDDEIDMKGVGPGYWSRAAKDGAERLLKWIARHEGKR